MKREGEMVSKRATAGRRGSLVVVAILAALVLPALADAVSVSPIALFIDHRTRSETLTLYNSGTTPEEIEIDFAFGYARSDSTGHVAVAFSDDPTPVGEPSVVPYLRAFPRRLVLQPGERQVVRVMVTPPADLPAGEYWGRVMVTSRGGQPPIEETRGDVQMQLSLTTVVAVAVNYRHGDVATGLAVESAEAVATSEGVDLVAQVDRTGNAAFLGRLVAEVVSAEGRVLAEHVADMVAYAPTLWRFSIPMATDQLADGAVVRYRFEAVREGTPSRFILPAATVTGSVPVRAAAASREG
jgi:hypothetical protein